MVAMTRERRKANTAIRVRYRSVGRRVCGMRLK